MSAKSSNDRRICCCDWRDCADIQEKMCSLTDESKRSNDPWIHKSRFCSCENKSGNGPKMIALRGAIAHHFHLKGEKKNRTHRVAPHHFHQNVIVFQGVLSDPLSAEDAKKLDAENNRERALFDDINKFSKCIPPEVASTCNKHESS